MIFSIEERNASAVALKSESGKTVSYGELSENARLLGECVGHRCLVFCLCRNIPASVVGYIGLVSSEAVPLLLDAELGEAALKNLSETYRPSFFWAPEEAAKRLGGEKLFAYDGYVLLRTENPPCEIHPQTALLLATSGSTGSPKLVRLSRRNLEANAESIAQYLKISAEDRPITTLPMNYTYGLSIINSHLLCGATILMTEKSVVELPFWKFFLAENATTFGGVPYTYEILKRMRIFTMRLPSLRYVTQAGGKLPSTLQQEFGEWAEKNGVEFVVMYGQTEATARMAYLPPENCLRKLGSMGIAIPGGSFRLVDTEGKVISEPDVEGELIYAGENVSLGYAECLADLRKGDERGGVLETGDVAKCDTDGYYYIVGRKKRFVKIFGVRISLDESEQLLKNHFPGQDFACVGRDDLLEIYLTDEALPEAAKDYLAETLKLNPSAFRANLIAAIPKSDSGKTVYKELEVYG